MKYDYAHLIKKILPLPPHNKRRFLPFLAQKNDLIKNFNTERDCDYIFYQAGALIENISLFALILTLIDITIGTEILVNQGLLSNNKSTIISAWGKITGPAVFIIGWLAYLRARLPLNIKNQQITFMVNKNFWRKRQSRRFWCQMSFFISVLGLFIFPLVVGHFYIDEKSPLAKLHIHDNIYSAIICLAFFAFALGIFSTLSLSCALIWEKSYRFYEQAKEDFDNW